MMTSSVQQAEGRVMGRRFVLTLVFGISAGCSFAYIFLTSSVYTRDVALSANRYNREASTGFKRRHILAISDHKYDEPAHKAEDRSVAEALARKVRVLCVVMTQPKNHLTKAQQVKATWGKRCNKLIFISTEDDPSLPAIKLPLVEEGHNHLWGKTKAAFKYVYEQHKREADWFMKADDDTYVIVENLRYMLSKYNPHDPLFFGSRFQPFSAGSNTQGYVSGAAGYVLSSEALERFVNKGLPSPHYCRPDDQGAEDAELGICLDKIGVKAMDSSDELKKGRFFPFSPIDHLFPNKINESWYWSSYYYKHEGPVCCSDYTITFHFIQPDEMYVFEYLIYHLRPYGISYGVLD